MIDWAAIGAGALWVSGLAVMLAACSRGHWLAGERHQGLRAVLATPAVEMACHAGLFLVCTGLFFSVDALWKRLGWAVVGLLSALQVGQGWRKGALSPAQGSGPDQAPAGVETPGATLAGRWSRLGAAVGRVELWWVLAALPLLLFPSRYSPWALSSLALLWVLRWAATGHLTVRTPVDAPALVLVLLLPISWYFSADKAMTDPALYRLISGVALFYAVLNWAAPARRLEGVLPSSARRPQAESCRRFGREVSRFAARRLAVAAALLVLLGLGLAAIAPFAPVSWSSGKWFDAPAILARLRLGGHVWIQEDINANVLAGGLILIWPVAAALLPARIGGDGLAQALLRLGLAGSLAAMSAILLLTQSRGAWLALGLALAVMGVLRFPALRGWALLSGVTVLFLLWRSGPQQWQRWGDALSNTGAITSLAGRQEAWSRAIYMIQDFAYTGIGMGTFDLVQPLLYPFFLHSGLIHHVHNLYLQVAVDLGLPGLIAYLALCLGSLYAAWRVWRASNGPFAALALGLLGSQVAWLALGWFEAGIWVSKLAFLPWWVAGLTAALERLGRLPQAPSCPMGSSLAVGPSETGLGSCTLLR